MLRVKNLALECGIQKIGEGMKGVGFSDLGRLKERDLLWFGKEIDAIRRYRPLPTAGRHDPFTPFERG